MNAECPSESRPSRPPSARKSSARSVHCFFWSASLARRFALAASAAAAIALPGCESGFWWGDGLDPEATVKAAVETPDEIQSGDVTVEYYLEGNAPATDVEVTYSTDGETFQKASEAWAETTEGTANLAVSSLGSRHVFIWDSGRDLAGRRESQVVVEIAPIQGTPGRTEPLRVHNAVILAGVVSLDPGRVQLYSFDPSAVRLAPLGAVPTGGDDPFDIVYLHGHFLVAHTVSSDVAVLKLDEAAQSLTPVDGSPFKTRGDGAKYLATDGKRVFVSNTKSGTVSVFDFDPLSGRLELGGRRSTSSPGCRSLLVRSGRLYVAGETMGHIAIFDIHDDGTLSTSETSPVKSEGLRSPTTLVASEKYLYAANAASRSLCAFKFTPEGGLKALAGSPFSLSEGGVVDMAVQEHGSKLIAVTGSGSSLLSMTVGTAGSVREDGGSPTRLDGAAYSVLSVKSLVLTPLTGTRTIKTWDFDGVSEPAEVDSLDAGADLIRAAVSD